MAEQLEFTAERRRWLKRAALLHDIGKLGASNAILDKPDKLDEAEWEVMHMHSAHSGIRKQFCPYRRVWRTRPDRRRAS
ncbi:HD domain-containing protein [Bradyrhizobium sp. 132]|uniref:HD-GYP domain-containing protein n=1 Tax=unclassified Bradyrhizobium TaxID=2631580 RepID=UPI003211DFE2